MGSKTPQQLLPVEAYLFICDDIGNNALNDYIWGNAGFQATCNFQGNDVEIYYLAITILHVFMMLILHSINFSATCHLLATMYQDFFSFGEV